MHNNGKYTQVNTNGGQRQIVAVKKYGSDVEQFKLDDGTVIDQETAVEMVENGIIQGYQVAVRDSGESYIRGIPDGNPDNNLQNLPRF